MVQTCCSHFTVCMLFMLRVKELRDPVLLLNMVREERESLVVRLAPTSVRL